jgi:hypothetical protein
VKPLRVYVLVPETRPIALGQAVVDGKPTAEVVAQGELEQEAPTPAISHSSGGPDESNVAGWLGAGKLGTFGGDQPHDNFVAPLRGTDPLSAWGNAMTPSKRRLTFAMTVSQQEHDWHFSSDTEERIAGAPADARFVRWFRGHRFFGATLGFDFASDCAVGALADVLGAAPVIRKRGPAPDPDRGALLDPSKRADIQNVLVRDGAQAWVAIVSNRPRPELEAKLRASTCSAADLTACSKLLEDLGEARLAGSPWGPTDYDALTRNEGEWSVTSFASGALNSLH